MKEHLLAPAGLEDTGFIGDERLKGSGRAATRLDPQGRPTGTAADWCWGWGYRGMGGVVTTTEDLLRWDRALRGDALLDAKARAELHRPRLAGYACGWLIETTERGTTKAHHSGSVEGFGAQLVRWLDEDAFVAVLSNGRTDPTAVAEALEVVLFPRPVLRLTVDAKGYELSEGADSLQLPAVWEVTKGEGTTLRLVDPARKHVLATIALPAGPTLAMARGLEEALRIGGTGDPGEAVEGGVYLLGSSTTAGRSSCPAASRSGSCRATSTGGRTARRASTSA